MIADRKRHALLFGIVHGEENLAQTNFYNYALSLQEKMSVLFGRLPVKVWCPWWLLTVTAVSVMSLDLWHYQDKCSVHCSQMGSFTSGLLLQLLIDERPTKESTSACFLISFGFMSFNSRDDIHVNIILSSGGGGGGMYVSCRQINMGIWEHGVPVPPPLPPRFI